jgi:hypothetical protein
MNSKKRLNAGKKIPVDADFYGRKLIGILTTGFIQASADFTIFRANLRFTHRECWRLSLRGNPREIEEEG